MHICILNLRITKKMNVIRSLTLTCCYLTYVLCYAHPIIADNDHDRSSTYSEVSYDIAMPIPIELLPENEDVATAAFISARNIALSPVERQSLPPYPDNKVTVYVTATEFGQLERLLTENDADAASDIIVSGPINQSDFKALWNCAAKGNLRVLDLGNAQIKDKIVPDRALFDPIEFETGKWLGIRKIILPDDVVRIGIAAFPCMFLEEINIPSSLKELGTSAFTYDRWLDCPMDFPEGMQEIGNQTFYDCIRLSHPVRLPSTMRKIGPFAFGKTPVPEIKLNDGLEVIEEYAFHACGMKELRIPDSVVEIGSGAFSFCSVLERIDLPKRMEIVPYSLCSNCYGLKKVNIPEGVRVIDHDAFTSCMGLKEVVFPKTLEIIGQQAFEGCAMDVVVLPFNLKRLGYGCFLNNSLNTVYCESLTPPECERRPYDQCGPFGESQISEAVLYVPEGYGKSYAGQWEWNMFKEIAETADFPSSGISTVMPDVPADDIIYDLSGRKVAHPQPNQIYIKNGKKTYTF